MTLIVTANGRESIWLLADRRLSYKDRAPRDDARKIMFLEAPDGVAILGYAGLGATALGTEPADWMSAVLRDRNLPLERSLSALAEAMVQQLPPHLLQLPVSSGPIHNLLATAFLNGEARLYTIDLVFAEDRKNLSCRYARHVVSAPRPTTRSSPLLKPPRTAIGGSGAHYLAKQVGWSRAVLRLVSAYDRGKLPALGVAAELAKLNYKVYQNVRDGSVGPSCIVAWRHRADGVHKSGAAHQFFTGEAPDPSSPSLPTIAHGMDIDAFVQAMKPSMSAFHQAMRTGQPISGMNVDELNAEVRRLLAKKDKNLR